VSPRKTYLTLTKRPGTYPNIEVEAHNNAKSVSIVLFPENGKPGVGIQIDRRHARLLAKRIMSLLDETGRRQSGAGPR
jgi:hypothetical protein